MRVFFALPALLLGAALSASLIFLPHTAPTYTVITDTSALYLEGNTFAHPIQSTLKIRLNNGLEALLISDPSLSSGGAALAVQAGSWDAPEGAAGLPHFIEHMLFLGSEGYPDEQGFSLFIDQHGGEKNAYTSDVFTSYFFTVDAPALHGALQRFAELFRAPLFNPDSLERERLAIDQEHAKNRGNEGRRALFVQKELALQSHPHHIFSTGDKSTLADVTAQQLRAWWQTHYSAKNMRLIVYAPDALDTLADSVADAFGRIPAPVLADKPALPSPFSAHLAKNIVYIEPIKPMMQLQIHWELPAELSGASSGAAELAALLSAPEPGSLTDLLQNEGLASAVNSYSTELGLTAKSFSLEISLTNEGVQKVNDVITRVFQALAFYRTESVPKETLESLRRAALLRLRYAGAATGSDLSEELSDLASDLPFEAMEHFPALARQPYQAQASDIQKLASAMTLGNSHFLLLAPATLTGVPPTNTEQWLGARYAVRPLSQQIQNIADTLAPHRAMKLPQPNPYLPTDEDLRLRYSEKHSPAGAFLADDEAMKIFWQGDGTLQRPYEVWQFEIHSPLLEKSDVRTSVLADLFTDAVHEALYTSSSLAQSAGNSRTFKRCGTDFCLRVSGYSTVAQTLLTELVGALTHSAPTLEEFQQMQKNLLTRYSFATQSSSLTHTLYTFSLLTHKNMASLEEKKKAVMAVSYNEFIAFEKRLFAQRYIRGSIYGNASREEAERFLQTLPDLLPGSAYRSNSNNKEEETEQPAPFSLNKAEAEAGESDALYVWSHQNSVGNALLLLIQEPEEFADAATNVQLEFAMQAIQSPYFAALRTKQQTAYLVDSTTMEAGDDVILGAFMIQSNSYEPQELLERTEAFLDDFLAKIEEGTAFTEEEFLSIRHALIARMKEAPGDSDSAADCIHAAQFSHDGDVHWQKAQITALEQLTYEQICRYMKKIFCRSNSQRLAIATYGVTSSPTPGKIGRPQAPAAYAATSSIVSARELLMPK